MPDDAIPPPPPKGPESPPGALFDLGFRSAATSPSPPWQPPAVGELQAQLPQYEITDFVARGGMGAVYKGTQKTLDRVVAIKVLPPDIGHDDLHYADRFKQEAKAMARLPHPGIVTVHDAGETASGLLYFVMEFIEGTDLARLLESEGKVAPRRALAITGAVLDALAFAHEEGIIHRDLKPSNIMLDTRGRVKVVDFGLAKVVTRESGCFTRSDLALGTADFIAPEAKTPGVKTDARADVYAVGVMLYQMLTGEVPRGSFDAPSGVVERMDPRLDAIVLRAMKTDPGKRYASAAEMQAAIEAAGQAKRFPYILIVAAVIITVPAIWLFRKQMRPQTGADALEAAGSSTSLASGQSAKPDAPPAVAPGPTRTWSAPAPAIVAGVGWTDLIPAIKPERDAIRGTWTVDKTGLTVQRAEWALCNIPVQVPKGDYDLRYRLTRGEGSDLAMFFLFRKGDAGGDVLIDYLNKGVSPGHAEGIHWVTLEHLQSVETLAPSAPKAGRKAWLPRGKMCTVLLQVREKEVIVSVDDEQVLRWVADWSKLDQRGRAASPLFKNVAAAPIFGIGAFNCDVVFHSIEMRQ
ncbi:MAG: serine/threonine protein kinase [Verrucomicrobiales bacterium]|nr:serine/threonine protein kinase [Verrucomicrobiales bacterium]